MSRFFQGWTTGTSASEGAGFNDDSSDGEEAALLQQAMDAANLIMNDELDLAERKLHAGNSVYHVAGRGVILFLKAMLGFEQEVMRQASARLVEVENMAWKELQRAQRDSKSWRSDIYPPGTQYAICLASTQIMLAILGVLSQSVPETIKGFYKARKAYQTLEAAAEAEAKYLKEHGLRNADEALIGEQDTRNGSVTKDANSVPESGLSKEYSQDPLSHPIDKWVSSTTSSQFGVLLTMISMVPPSFTKLLSIVGFKGDRKRGLDLLWRASASPGFNGSTAGLVLMGYYNNLVAMQDIRKVNAYPEARLRDLLGVMRQRYPQSQLWLLETARVLSAEKDIESAIRLLSQDHPGPEKSRNKYPNGPSSADEGPDSSAKEENGSSAKPVAVLEEGNPMFKQLTGLKLFQLSLDYMYLHDYQSCADNFLKYIPLTDFGHGIYYYMAGAAHVELYRIYSHGGAIFSLSTTPTSFTTVAADSTIAARHAQLAEQYLTEAPKHTGKKRLFGRPLPFDVFVARKINKWQRRATTLGCPLADAPGSSPFEELIYFWGGYGRMLEPQLEHSLERLSWANNISSDPKLDSDKAESIASVTSSAPQKQRHAETFDDQSITVLLRACIYRRLKRVSEASTLLRTEIIDKHPWSEFKTGASSGGFGDTYPAPLARYELAACLWADRYHGPMQFPVIHDETGQQLDNTKLATCRKLLDEISRWDSFDLDQRVSHNISTGQATLKSLGHS